MEIYKEAFLLASKVIKKAQNILLVPHAKMDCDGMSSALALHKVLQAMGKNPTAVCYDPVPETFRFLPSTEVFQQKISDIQIQENQTIVTINASDKKFSDLQYNVKDGKVNIIISADGNPFAPSDFSFLESSLQPDLIICLDSGDVKQLGKIYEDNTDLFSTVPVLNIDHHISNTQFGTVNLVEMKNSSTTEIVYDLIPYLDERGHDLVDEDIATLLLAGLITDTGSFQHSNTTPKALDTAAELIELGARQQEIIKHLFKTKSLATLRLWGKVLTQLKNDPIYRMVWSSISKEDLQETLSHSDDAEGLIDELLSTTPGTEMVLLVKEREDGLIATSVRTSSSLVDATVFADKFGGGGHRQAAGFKIRERGGKSFDEIVADIVYEAKIFQSNRLGLTPPVANISEISSVINLSQPEGSEMKPDETVVSSESNINFPDFVTPENSDHGENTPSEVPLSDPSEISHLQDTSSQEESEIPVVNNFADMLEVNMDTNNASNIPEAVENTENISPLHSEDTTPKMNQNEDVVVPEISSEEVSITPVEEGVPHSPEISNYSEETLFPYTSQEENAMPEFLEKKESPIATPVVSTPENFPEESPAFLSQDVLDINTNTDEEVKDEHSSDSDIESDEFALFLEKAKEKEEDEKFDTTFQPVADSEKSVVSSEIPVIPVVSENSPEEENFGEDFLEALHKENPVLSPISTPSEELEPIEKPLEENQEVLPDWMMDTSEDQVTQPVSLPENPLLQQSEDDFLNALPSENNKNVDPVPVESIPVVPDPVVSAPKGESEDDFLDFLNQENSQHQPRT